MAALDGSQAKKELDEAGAIAIQAGGETIRLTAEELLIETAQTDGYVTAEDWGTSVVLDTTLTDELIEEGFVREITSKIQSMRKDAGFDVMDHIVVYQKGSERVAEILRNHREEIASDVLAEDICLGELGGLHRRLEPQRRRGGTRREKDVRCFKGQNRPRSRQHGSGGRFCFLCKRRKDQSKKAVCRFTDGGRNYNESMFIYRTKYKQNCPGNEDGYDQKQALAKSQMRRRHILHRRFSVQYDRDRMARVYPLDDVFCGRRLFSCDGPYPHRP